MENARLENDGPKSRAGKYRTKNGGLKSRTGKCRTLK